MNADNSDSHGQDSQLHTVSRRRGCQAGLNHKCHVVDSLSLVQSSCHFSIQLVFCGPESIAAEPLTQPKGRPIQAGLPGQAQSVGQSVGRAQPRAGPGRQA